MISQLLSALRSCCCFQRYNITAAFSVASSIMILRLLLVTSNWNRLRPHRLRPHSCLQHYDLTAACSITISQLLAALRSHSCLQHYDLTAACSITISQLLSALRSHACFKCYDLRAAFGDVRLKQVTISQLVSALRTHSYFQSYDLTAAFRRWGTEDAETDLTLLADSPGDLDKRNKQLYSIDVANDASNCTD